MNSFQSLTEQFNQQFNTVHFPPEPASLYLPNEYFLGLGGKRIRPVLCLMGNELIDEIKNDAWLAGNAIELFHNFTLIHDDIMDKAPLRRGNETVYKKYGENTAILAGDVMLIAAYDELNKISTPILPKILKLFGKTAREVCEGQQLDMDFEKLPMVSLNEYMRMIELKTSVLLAASLTMGAIIAGASERNRNLLYEFGKNLGLAFQIQDDYLDAFGDPVKFGKQVGGDILSNKKTFLLIHSLEVADATQAKEIKKLLQTNAPDKVANMLQLYRDCKADEWTLSLKNKYFDAALRQLDDIAVPAVRKEPLQALAEFLVQRNY